MEPRHFWWLMETLDPPRKSGPDISEADRKEMLALLRQAEKEAAEHEIPG